MKGFLHINYMDPSVTEAKIQCVLLVLVKIVKIFASIILHKSEHQLASITVL